MGRGRPLEPLNITEDVRSQLDSISRSRSMPHSLVRRARIVLLSDGGLTNHEIRREAWSLGCHSREVAPSFLQARSDGALRRTETRWTAID